MLKEWSPDYKKVIFSALDPINGRGRELFNMNVAEDTNWELSPDGTRLVLFGVSGPIRILTMADGSIREVVAKGWKGMDYVTWANDGKGLYGSTPTRQGAILLHVNLQGSVHVVWEYRGGLWITGIPSPDGRHIALQGLSMTSNMWMMENF